jgi:hypothetical protein
METMSKTAALKEARRLVSISGSGTSWQIYGPYRLTDLDGPSTSVSADSYWNARRRRGAWVADIAATLMGINPDGIEHHYFMTGEERIEALLAAAIRESQKA